jgi:hypothetical protein
MSEKEQEILSNQSTEYENTIFSKTGYSNSRLNRHYYVHPRTKIKFDAMTIVGNLIKTMPTTI